MDSFIYFSIGLSTSLIMSTFTNDLASSVSVAIEWAKVVAIFVCAAMMAIALIAWLIHRS